MDTDDVADGIARALTTGRPGDMLEMWTYLPPMLRESFHAEAERSAQLGELSADELAAFKSKYPLEHLA